MLYTIGSKDVYDDVLSQDWPVLKSGPTDVYEGGCVWQTAEKAEAQCPEGYDVYGIDGDWEKHTAPNPNETYRNLTVSRPLFKL